MIITKTPFRISFAGGGTDLKAFYEYEQGAVLSATINKYMYLALHRYFENKILLKYSKTELVDHVQDIQHPLIRHCFLKTKIRDPLEVTSFADIPSSGTGLGSSSAFTIGLLKALYTFQHKNKENLHLAEEACDIEISELKEPIGKQDQYACAVGGINVILFNTDGSVFVEPVMMKPAIKKKLEQNLVLYYTGLTRKASTILAEQTKVTKQKEKLATLRTLRSMVFELRDALTQGNLSTFGEILHRGWLLKQSLVNGISNPEINAYYERAISLGALGGKLLGAGGGGFFLFYCPQEKQHLLKAKLGLREVPFVFDPQGSRIIYMEEEES
ncbi:GHMP kinase [Candidatus Woesearchaeota archaeon]|nr:GHMP kinase [Candidatus Woesearchaeota archaeon]